MFQRLQGFTGSFLLSDTSASKAKHKAGRGAGGDLWFLQGGGFRDLLKEPLLERRKEALNYPSKGTPLKEPLKEGPKNLKP